MNIFFPQKANGEGDSVRAGLLLSGFLFFVYLAGIFCLAHVQKLSWQTAPVFWVGIVQYPFWVKMLSGLTICSGTLLIYFVPGIFIARYFVRDAEDRIETFLVGFLINYIFYYVFSTLYKLVSQQEFSREVMIALMATEILGTVLVSWVISKGAVGSAYKGMRSFSSYGIGFIVFYVITIGSIFFIFHEKILFSHFGGGGDGAEQYWLAHGLKSKIWPTEDGYQVSMITQYVFAPSLYLNMFALVLFGHAEFIIKIEILSAYISLGFLFKGVVQNMRGGKRMEMAESAPLFLYFAILFVIIAFHSGYIISPADLAKSNETLQLAFFLAGLYLLTKNNGSKILTAVFFVLAAMIRYNGFFMATFFLVCYSVIFKKYKCLLWYLAGVIFLVLCFLIPFSYQFKKSFMDLWRDVASCNLINQAPELRFLLAYIKNYFVLTAGLSVFLVVGARNRHVLLMLLSTLFFLVLPSWAVCVPAHYFVPVIMFPLIAYYLTIAKSKMIIVIPVIILELLTLAFLSPKTHFSRPTLFENVLSRVCVNEANQFEAFKKVSALERFWLKGIDGRALLYYADLTPKRDKKYWLYCDVGPQDADRFYEKKFEQKRIFLLKGIPWERFAALETILREDYRKGDPCYCAVRKNNFLTG